MSLLRPGSQLMQKSEMGEAAFPPSPEIPTERGACLSRIAARDLWWLKAYHIVLALCGLEVRGLRDILQFSKAYV